MLNITAKRATVIFYLLKIVLFSGFVQLFLIKGDNNNMVENRE